MDKRGNNSIYPRYQEGSQVFSSISSIQKYAPNLLATSTANTTSSQRKLSNPSLQLTGHGSEVYCVKFSPNGNILASAGFDKTILLWDIFSKCNNYALLKGHSNAILQINWSSDGSKLYSCSADKSICIWDAETGKRDKKYKGHTEVVNSIFPARRGLETLVTGSDDGKIKIWDLRMKESTLTFDLGYPITAVTFNDTAEKVFFGGIDNTLKSLDLRKGEVEYSLEGHTENITGVTLSHDGSYLLSNSVDQTIRCWDIRPYVLGNRCLKIFQGGTHNQEKNLLRVDWSPDGQSITAGSADGYLYIWDTTTRRIKHRLGGHNGAINEAVFSPKDNLVASASSDKTIIIGELPDVSL